MTSPSDPWFLPAVTAAAVVVAGLGLWALWRIIRDAGRAGVAVATASGEAATRVAEGLARVLRDSFNLHPRITIAGKTSIEGPRVARELVLVKQSMERCHEWSSQRLWSTKRMTLSARFTVSVGFDLTRPIDIDVGSDGHRARVTLPQPKILAVQIDAMNPALESDGWWNRITPGDRALVQQEMQQRVEQDARDGGLLALADTEFRRVLAGEMQRQGGEIEFRVLPDALASEVTPGHPTDARLAPPPQNPDPRSPATGDMPT